MTSESKILTVSYGTFSCTLEGFDDPFITMKAIAEYFRDLAAEDRYFGAEPPQPDAAMLHRIAEREVTRLVGARVRDAAPTSDAPSGAGSQDDRTAARITGRPRVPLGGSVPAAQPDEPPVIEPSLQDIIPTGVAAKLARIRQAIDPQPISGASLAAEMMGPEPTAAPVTEAPVAEAPVTEAPVTEAAVFDESAPDWTSLSDGAADAHGATPDTSAEVLSRLGELIHAPGADQDDADASDASGPSLPDDTAEAQDSSVDSWLVETDDALLLSDVPDTVQAADLPELAAEIVAEAAELDATPPVADEALAISLADELPPVAEVLEAAPGGADPMADAPLPEDAIAVPETLEAALREDPVAESLVEPSALDAEAALAQALELTPEDERGGSETDAAPAADRAEAGPVAAEAVEADVPAVAAESEQPAAGGPSKATGKTKRVNSRVVRIHAEDEAAFGGSPNGSEAEMARLLRQTDDVMSDEDNRRRLESIAHMKAAVAATEADRAATGAPVKEDAESRLDPYRDVLAQVVQPDPAPAEADKPTVKPRRKSVSVRPQEPRPGTIRPGMISPPPLVLVSEQRIDRIDAPPPPPPPPQPADVGAPMVAMRTGRLTGAIGVGAAAANPMPQKRIVLEQPSRAGAPELDEDEDFDEDLTEAHEAGLASFAERVGVKSMADMLEAAAAYATCIEKRENFTRPQLMRRLMASAGGKSVSREEGLRSFGTLLRTGRIEKVNRGQYVLAEHSPYLAEARRLH